jgi:GNAT superfamily N-acetyltransferase
MRVEACTEGYRFMERLATDWEAGVTRFDRDGEALVGARVDDVLAGIGGLTLDPVVSGALRMRRFYVRPSFRKHGIGRKLVGTLLEYPRRGQAVVVRGSQAFWEKLGFAPDLRDGHTHILHFALGDTSA